MTQCHCYLHKPNTILQLAYYYIVFVSLINGAMPMGYAIFINSTQNHHFCCVPSVATAPLVSNEKDVFLGKDKAAKAKGIDELNMYEKYVTHKGVLLCPRSTWTC